MKTVFLSPTKYFDYVDCHYKYYLRWEAKVKRAVRPANLVFGDLVAQLVKDIFTVNYQGKEIDAAVIFEGKWLQATSQEPIEYSATQDADGLLETGKYLVENFLPVWQSSGLVPLVAEDGSLATERSIKVDLGSGVVLSTRIDVAAMNIETGEVCLIDQKTPATESDPEFALVSEQLTAGQLAVQLDGSSIGIDRVDKVGFQELVKRKIPTGKSKGRGPAVHKPVLVPARSEHQLMEFRTNLIEVAHDIRKGRFNKTPRQSHNSPCDMCDFKNYCWKGEKDGLVFPDEADPQRRLVAVGF